MSDKLSSDEAKRFWPEKKARRRLSDVAEPKEFEFKRVRRRLGDIPDTPKPMRRRLTKGPDGATHTESTRTRPPVFRDEFIETARIMCEEGATINDLAEQFGVARWTIDRWRSTIPDFRAVIKVAKEVADERVKHSFYERVTGYSYPAVKIMVVNGEVKREEYMEHVPPDVGGAQKWLANRDRENWGERSTHEMVGSFDVKQITLTMTPQEAAEAYMDYLRQPRRIKE